MLPQNKFRYSIVKLFIALFLSINLSQVYADKYGFCYPANKANMLNGLLYSNSHIKLKGADGQQINIPTFWFIIKPMSNTKNYTITPYERGIEVQIDSSGNNLNMNGTDNVSENKKTWSFNFIKDSGQNTNNDPDLGNAKLTYDGVSTILFCNISGKELTEFKRSEDNHTTFPVDFKIDLSENRQLEHQYNKNILPEQSGDCKNTNYGITSTKWQYKNGKATITVTLADKIPENRHSKGIMDLFPTVPMGSTITLQASSLQEFIISHYNEPRTISADRSPLSEGLFNGLITSMAGNEAIIDGKARNIPWMLRMQFMFQSPEDAQKIMYGYLSRLRNSLEKDSSIFDYGKFGKSQDSLNLNHFAYDVQPWDISIGTKVYDISCTINAMLPWVGVTEKIPQETNKPPGRTKATERKRED